MTPTSSIYLSSIKFIGDPLQASNCRCLGEMPHQQYGQNIPTIPFDKLISAIINSEKVVLPIYHLKVFQIVMMVGVYSLILLQEDVIDMKISQIMDIFYVMIDQ